MQGWKWTPRRPPDISPGAFLVPRRSSLIRDGGWTSRGTSVERTGATVAAVGYLRTPDSVRERAHNLLSLAEQDALDHFVYCADRLPCAIDCTFETIRLRYPDLAIPFHSRWRHFATDGKDRWMDLSGNLAASD